MTSDLSLAFLAPVMLGALLASLAIWSRRAMRVRLLALAAMVGFTASLYVALTDMLSRPKPIALEWSMPDPEKSAIVASQLREGEAIFLWLMRDADSAPQAYRLPWSEELARQLHESQREASQTGTAVRMNDPRDGNLAEGERVFYAEPHQSLPAKQQAAVE